MTVSSTTAKSSYAGNGVTTAFSTGFRFLQDSDILATLVNDSTGVETTLTLTTHYSLTGAGDAGGGTLTMVTEPATGETLIISRDMDITQETDYVENDPFSAETHEEALDKLTMIVQQINEVTDRTIVLALSTPSGVSAELPAPAADQFFRWNSTGTALEGVTLSTTGSQPGAVTYENLNANGDIGFGASQVPDGGEVVQGPASTTDDNIAVFDGTTGKLLKDGGAALSAYAPLASPALTGAPTAPTQSAADNSTKVATTAYADTAADNAKEEYILLEDTKAQGTGGGTATAGSWLVRDIAESVDVGNNVVVSGNQITFTNAGTYQYEIKVPFHAVNQAKARLYHVTDAAVEKYGTATNSSAAATVLSTISGRVTVSASDVLRIEYRVQTTAANGLGQPAGWGDEIYTQAEFWKID